MKEQIKETLESEQIAPVLEELVEWIGGSLLDEDRTGPPYVLAPNRDRYYARLVGRNPHMRNPRRQRLKKGMLAAALLLAVPAAVHASAIKAFVSNYFIRVNEESVDFSFQAAPNQSTLLLDTALPGYVPPGYRLEKSEIYGQILSLIYTRSNRQEENIRLCIYADRTSIRLNHENAEKQGPVLIHGQSGFYSVVGDKTLLVWGNAPAYLLMGPNGAEAHLLLMAESIAPESDNGQK